MMHRAWSCIVEVPYSFSRSYVKFPGHTALKIVEFDPNWAFPDSNSSFNAPMAMKCCTKLETAKEGCPIVFQGHPSNFKVTRDKTSPILTQIGRFQTIGRSQLSNPSDLPCYYTPAQRSWRGGILDSPCPSVRPSVRPSVCRWHGFRSISQVCFGISILNFICVLMVAIGRSLLIFSNVTFKMAAWRPYSIFWFPDSNFTLVLNINFKLRRHNTYVYG